MPEYGIVFEGERYELAIRPMPENDDEAKKRYDEERAKWIADPKARKPVQLVLHNAIGPVTVVVDESEDVLARATTK